MSEALAAPTSDVPRDADLAFDQLYRTSREDVYAYAAGLLRDRAAAEEVTAVAFERAYRKRSRFNPDRGSARAWLFGIARNAALDELRRRKRHAELTTQPIDGMAGIDSQESDQREIRVVLVSALERLEGSERELIALKFFAGLSNAEIADVLGLSESNAGTKVHRIVNKLREACDAIA